MRFQRLRLAGFKSFVDPAELRIENGLTGVVGPNGCGKSNLLEAIRWVMGESSPKSLRGGGMEDIIFAGTALRPSRDFADVTLLLDNSARKGPPQYNDSDQIEVTRRIERGLGSAYRINGKDVRQKDVQLLFADAATGAHSPALVSQNRVGAIIAAKPQERRAMLEEAAGISGLHVRRKDAEQRLRAAEANLARLDDVLSSMETQIFSLKRQARQAERYRILSDRIRTVEAQLLFAKWRDAAAAADEAKRAAGEIEAKVTEATRAAARVSAAQADAAAGLPALRQAEANAAATVQAMAQMRQTLAAELSGVERRQQELGASRDATARDLAREATLGEDATAALARLSSEAEMLGIRASSARERLAAAVAHVAQAEKAASNDERALSEHIERQADAQAQHRAAAAALLAADNRVRRARDEHARLERERETLLVGDDSESRRTAAEAALAAAESALAEAAARIEAADAARSAAEAVRDEGSRALAAARDEGNRALIAAREEGNRALAAAREEGSRALLEARGRHGALLAERDALVKLVVSPSTAAAARSALDAIRVAPGYEAALAAALGDDLSANVGRTDTGRSWAGTEAGAADPALPDGLEPLAKHVEAPAELARRLAQVALADAGEARGRVAALAVGQRLVSRDGRLWRWDGFEAHGGQSAAAAERLVQRNRLTELEAQLPAAEAAVAEAQTQVDAAVAEAQARLDAAVREAQARMDAAVAEAQARVTGATAKFNTAVAAEREARTARTTAERARDAARGTLATLAAALERRNSRLEALDSAIRRAAADLGAAEGDAETARAAQAGLPDVEALNVATAEARRVVEASRAALAAARADHAGLARSIDADDARLRAIEGEREGWERRVADSAAQAEELGARQAAIDAELAELAERPAAIAARQAVLADELHAAEAARKAAADALAAAENGLRAFDAELRATNEALAAAREERARLGANAEHFEARRVEMAHMSGERFQCPPPLLPERLGFDAERVGVEAALTADFERLTLERERLGPVNLRAETELAEIEATRSTSVAEREELETAIARLRGSIGSLNREGRVRLLAAFEAVNAHFRELFTTLFGGGAAHLELIESDDPLEAGLEIMAQPPGKKLQSLTLLSGGEQALTAVALIFGVFLTNPAPICVLDEVDAPLDDANVERFCDLLDRMTELTDTRFMIVTHNAVTMARMHRLFGVTMAEKGVSQLVSVDLARANMLLAAE